MLLSLVSILVLNLALSNLTSSNLVMSGSSPEFIVFK